MTNSARGPSTDGTPSMHTASLNKSDSHSVVERLEPCRKCGGTDVSWWDGRGTQADLYCNGCGQEEGVQVIDLFEGEAKDRPLLDAAFCYPADLVAKAKAHLAAEWNTRAAATIISELEAELGYKNNAISDYILGDDNSELARAKASEAYMGGVLGRELELHEQTRQQLSAAESSLDRVRAETVWQPIETAPKDGTWVLVNDTRHRKERSSSMAQWDDCKYATKPRPYWAFVDERVFGVTTSRSNQPTHWQPLPTSPAIADTNADAPGNISLVSGISADPSSLTKTGGMDSGAVKTAESCHSPSTREG